MLKDIHLMLAETRRFGLGAEALEGWKIIVERAIDKGYRSVDYSALYNGIYPPKD